MLLEVAQVFALHPASSVTDTNVCTKMGKESHLRKILIPPKQPTLCKKYMGLCIDNIIMFMLDCVGAFVVFRPLHWKNVYFHVIHT